MEHQKPAEERRKVRQRFSGALHDYRKKGKTVDLIYDDGVLFTHTQKKSGSLGTSPKFLTGAEGWTQHLWSQAQHLQS